MDILDKVNAASKRRERWTVSKTCQGLTFRTYKELLQINQKKADVATEIKMSKGCEWRLKVKEPPLSKRASEVLGLLESSGTNQSAWLPRTLAGM